MRIVAISDTHGMHRMIKIPKGDVLIHAGDITAHGNLDEVKDFNTWVGSLGFKNNLITPGNHDFCYERSLPKAKLLLTNAECLIDESVIIDGMKFFLSPWQPIFYDWAFNLPRNKLKEKWALIPNDTNVLITHGPPRGHGDKTICGDLAGCEELLEAIRRVKPRYHLFGHIHEGRGSTIEGNTNCVNVSTTDYRYRPTNPPVVIDI